MSRLPQLLLQFQWHTTCPSLLHLTPEPRVRAQEVDGLQLPWLLSGFRISFCRSVFHTENRKIMPPFLSKLSL